MGPGYLVAAQGVKTLGGLLGGKQQTPQIPRELRWLLENHYRSLRTDRFAPNMEAFDARTNSYLEGIYQNLGVNVEGVRANQASRGVYTGGEGAKYEYRDVVAPAMNQAAQAVTQSGVQLERMRLAGLQAAEQLKVQAAAQMVGAWRPEGGGRQLTWQDKLGSLLGDAGDFGTNYMILQSLGVFDSMKKGGN